MSRRRGSPPLPVRAVAAVLLAAATVATGLAAPVVVGAAEPDPATGCRADGPVAEAMLPAVEPIVRDWLGQHPHSETPGLAIGIVEPDPGAPASARTALITCGVLEAGSTSPVGPTTPFELGSETKLFTGVALARQALAGVVDLDSPVQDHVPAGVTVPDAPCNATTTGEMTLRDLATFNSGLVDDPANITWDASSNPEGHRDYDRTDLFDSFSAGWTEPCRALLSVPGTAYSYSNWGYALLGTILADQYRPGQAVPPYEAMMTDLVTGPLGMASTRLQPIPAPPVQAVPTCAPGASSPCWWDNVNAFAGAGGAVSDITDMATFVRANLGFDRTDPVWPALQLSQQPSGIGPACGRCLGFAWQITPAGQSGITPLELLDKNGGTWGSHSQTYLLPDACWGITVLSNSNEQDAVGEGGVTGRVLQALAPTSAAGGACGTTPPAPTPAAAPSAVVVPRMTG